MIGSLIGGEKKRQKNCERVSGKVSGLPGRLWKKDTMQLHQLHQS